ASTTDTTIMRLCALSMMLRRWKLSARAPLTSENSMTGSVVDACTSATMLLESLRDVMSQPAPTTCTSPPRLDSSVAVQSLRNIRCRNGTRGDVGDDDMNNVSCDLMADMTMGLALVLPVPVSCGQMDENGDEVCAPRQEKDTGM